MDDLGKKTLEEDISRAWLSHPQLGKHTAFDGRLLHGAPALYFPSFDKKNKWITNCCFDKIGMTMKTMARRTTRTRKNRAAVLQKKHPSPNLYHRSFRRRLPPLDYHHRQTMCDVLL